MSRNLIALQNKFLGHGQTVYDGPVAASTRQQGYIGDADIETHRAGVPPAAARTCGRLRSSTKSSATARPAKHVVKCATARPAAARATNRSPDTSRALRRRARWATRAPPACASSTSPVLGYCGLGPNADGRRTSGESSRRAGALERVISYATGDDPHGLRASLPTPAIMPDAGKACVLLRRFPAAMSPPWSGAAGRRLQRRSRRRSAA
jgi:hypothetical protein